MGYRILEMGGAQVPESLCKAGGRTLPDSTQHCRATVFKTRRSWHRNRPGGQWNRTQTPGTNPHIYGQLIFDRGIRMHNGGKTVSTASGDKEVGQPQIITEDS